MSDEQIMKSMRQEFIPRESLEIKFHHINGTLNKMNLAIEVLPKELIRELDDRLGSKIEKIEERLNRVEAFQLKMIGALIFAQVLIDTFKDMIFKK